MPAAGGCSSPRRAISRARSNARCDARGADGVQRRVPPTSADLVCRGAPTGMASEAEYLEIALAERCDPDEVRTALDAALPAGLDIVEVVEAGARSPQ